MPGLPGSTDLSPSLPSLHGGAGRGTAELEGVGVVWSFSQPLRVLTLEAATHKTHHFAALYNFGGKHSTGGGKGTH